MEEKYEEAIIAIAIATAVIVGLIRIPAVESSEKAKTGTISVNSPRSGAIVYINGTRSSELLRVSGQA